MEKALLALALGMGMLIRYVLPGKKYIGKILNTYLLYIGLPVLVFTSIKKVCCLPYLELGIISFTTLLVMIICIFTLVNLLKIPSKDQATLFLCSIFGNTAYLGIPILYILWGDLGAGIATIFTLVAMGFHLTVGLFLANQYVYSRKTFGKLVRSPFFWIILVAVLLAFSRIPASEHLSIITESIVYFAIFIIGTTLELHRIDLRIFIYALFKLCLVPIIMIPLLILFSVENPWPFLLLAAMPSAFINAPLSLEFNFNPELASKLITVSTAIFMVILLIFG